MFMVMVPSECGSSGCNGGKGDSVRDTVVAGADTGVADEEETDTPCPEDTEPPPADDTATEWIYYPVVLKQTDGTLLPDQLIDGDLYTYFDGSVLEVKPSNPFQCIDGIFLEWWCSAGVAEEGYPDATYNIWADGDLRSSGGQTCFQALGDPDTGDYGPQPYPGGFLQFAHSVKIIKIEMGENLRLSEIKAGYKTR